MDLKLANRSCLSKFVPLYFVTFIFLDFITFYATSQVKVAPVP